MSNMFAQGSLLGQLAPANTSAAAIFTATMPTEITLLFGVLNSGATMRVYHDQGGSTFAVGNRIIELTPGVGGDPVLFRAHCQGGGIMLAAGDSIGVEVTLANAATFSIYGVTATLADRVRGMQQR